MPLIAATNITHNFGDRPILEGVSLSIEPGDRIGIVGRNGAGKSTLLRILTGEIKADSGIISLQRGCRVGYLEQDHHFDPKETLRDAAEGAFEELHRLHHELNLVFEEMATASPDQLDLLMKKQVALETDFERAGGYAIEHKIEEVLHGLGFTDAQFSIPVGSLSGGQRGRLALARLLLEQPDLLLLDEPTNHLDIDGRMWLESFLKNDFNGAVVMISHDRYLLDNVVTKIIEVEACRLIDYPGNYQGFCEIRSQRRLTMQRAYEAQQTKFRKEEEYIRRFKAGQRARQAKGRESKLEREKDQNQLERPVEFATFRLELPKAERTSDVVISARELSKQYTRDDGSTKVLFKNLDLSVRRGERWGIIGPNGAGKTTVIRCLLGEVPPDAGVVRIGTNVKTGFYRQTHEHVPPDTTVYRYLQSVILKESPSQAMSEQQARNLAGSFLFSGEEQEKRMEMLSGGERSRAVLAGLLASAKNVLILDEPTNHLDIPSSERLEDALALPDEDGFGFDGTLLLISHDRALIDATCDHLLVFDGQGGHEIFLGNFSDWHAKAAQRQREKDRAAADERQRREDAERKRRAEEESRKKKASAPVPTNNALSRLKTDQLEVRIEKLETRIREIDAALGEPDTYRDQRKSALLGDERRKLLSDLEPLEFEWARRAELAE